jgi:hypothetical protein
MPPALPSGYFCSPGSPTSSVLVYIVGDPTNQVVVSPEPTPFPCRRHHPCSPFRHRRPRPPACDPSGRCRPCLTPFPITTATAHAPILQPRLVARGGLSYCSGSGEVVPVEGCGRSSMASRRPLADSRGGWNLVVPRWFPQTTSASSISHRHLNLTICSDVSSSGLQPWITSICLPQFCLISHKGVDYFVQVPVNRRDINIFMIRLLSLCLIGSTWICPIHLIATFKQG